MKKVDGHRDKLYIQALFKGLSVLECFRDTSAFGITEIGEIVGLPDSSVQRIVNTLEIKGYLYQNPRTKKYLLTPKVLLSYAHSTRFIKWMEQARKHMVALNEQYNENVNLAVRQDHMCRYIDFVESTHRLRPNFTLSDLYPIYCTALGRSLLSALSDSEIDASLPETLEQRTLHTVTDRKKLIALIKEIKGNHYAVDDEEFYLGLYCIGSPVYGLGDKVIAAISVTAPKVRMDEETVARLIPAVTNTAQLISEDYRMLFATNG